MAGLSRPGASLQSSSASGREEGPSDSTTDPEQLTCRRLKVHRITCNWKPEPLLCQRWGVADPWASKEFVDDSKKTVIPTFDESLVAAVARIAESVSTPTGRADVAREVSALTHTQSRITPATRAAIEAIKAVESDTKKELPSTSRWDQKPSTTTKAFELAGADQTQAEKADKPKVTTLKLILEENLDVEPVKRPPMQLFKDIFGEDSDEEITDA